MNEGVCYPNPQHQDLLRVILGLGFRVQGLGFRVQGLGFRVQGLGFRVYDTFKVPTRGGLRVRDLGVRDRGWGDQIPLASWPCRPSTFGIDPAHQPLHNGYTLIIWSPS